MIPSNELIWVIAFLKEGDLIAVPSGNMAGLYRIKNDAVLGAAALEYEGVAAITGASNVVRRVSIPEAHPNKCPMSQSPHQGESSTVQVAEPTSEPVVTEPQGNAGESPALSALIDCLRYRPVATTAAQMREAADRMEMMRAALLHIAEGRGAYSRDQHEFACNVIEEAKRTATAALEGRYEYKD